MPLMGRHYEHRGVQLLHEVAQGLGDGLDGVLAARLCRWWQIIIPGFIGADDYSRFDELGPAV